MQGTTFPGPAVAPADFNVAPADLVRVIGKLVAAWAGEKRQDAPFVTGFNTQGTKPPLFWVSQSQGEILALLPHLRPDQPIYGMKSVFLGNLGFQPQDTRYFIAPPFIDAVTDVFQRDIQIVCADRPFVLAGNCTGAVSAFDIALRGQLACNSLILMNYPLPAQPFAGKTELMFGEAEWADFSSKPQNMACFPQATVTIMDGAHGGYFANESVQKIVAATQRAVAALG